MTEEEKAVDNAEHADSMTELITSGAPVVVMIRVFITNPRIWFKFR